MRPVICKLMVRSDVITFAAVRIPRVAKVVTSLRTKNLHKSDLIYVHARWVIVCMTSVKGPEIRSYAAVATWLLYVLQ